MTITAAHAKCSANVLSTPDRFFACSAEQDEDEGVGLWYGVDAETKGEEAECRGIDILVDA